MSSQTIPRLFTRSITIPRFYTHSTSHTKTTMTQKPILISGAGLASLLLGQSLKRSNIAFQIFERDNSLAFRGQGYRLRLSNEGLDAIETVLGPEAFQRFYDNCGKTSGKGVVDLDALTGEKTDQIKFTENLASRDGKTVGIARGDMRRLFYEGIEDYVQFGKHVKGYEVLEDGVRAIFADGTKSDEACLLVGGEGIKSRVAPQVSGGLLKTFDTGARGIHGQAPASAFKNLGEGVFRIKDQTTKVSIITNVRPEPVDIDLGWTMIGPPGVIKAPNDDYTIVGKQAADIAQHLTSKWDQSIRPLFDSMNVNEAAFWKITCSTPSGVPQWTNEPRVTVIGDAAHSMTPAGGIGANTAVRDSALLGRLLHEAGGYYENVTAEYEKAMRVYASEAVATSYGLATKQMGVHIDENTTPTI